MDDRSGWEEGLETGPSAWEEAAGTSVARGVQPNMEGGQMAEEAWLASQCRDPAQRDGSPAGRQPDEPWSPQNPQKVNGRHLSRQPQPLS